MSSRVHCSNCKYLGSKFHGLCSVYICKLELITKPDPFKDCVGIKKHLSEKNKDNNCSDYAKANLLDKLLRIFDE